MNYPKIKSIEVLNNYLLRIIFITGDIRIYDCKPLLKKDAFKSLQNKNYFKTVKMDTGGYGISWDDEIDLAESELWINGEIESSCVAETDADYGTSEDK